MKKALLILVGVVVLLGVARYMGTWPFAARAVDMTGWMTYSDTTRGFSFKYPGDWTAAAGEELGGYAVRLSYIKDGQTYIGQSIGIGKLSEMELNSAGKPYTSLEEYVHASQFSDLHRVSIGGQPASVVSFYNPTLKETFVTGYLEHKGLIYQFFYGDATVKAIADSMSFTQ